MSVEEEIRAMEEMLSNNAKTESIEEVIDEVVEEETIDEEVKDEETKTDEKADEKEVIEEVKVPSEIDKLRNDISELKNLFSQKPVDEVKEEVEEIKPEDFVNGLDLDDLTRDPEQLNKLLNSVFSKGVEYARKEVVKTKQELLNTLPDYLTQRMETASELKKTVEKFYDNNPDLKQFKKVVSVVFDELVETSPNKNYKELLKDAEAEVRTRLELPRGVVKTNEDKPPRPPGKKGQSRIQQPVTPTNSFADEIAAMDKALNN
jgi:hypothetical protein